MIKKLALIILLLAGCKTVPVTRDNTPLTGYTAATLTVLGMSCPLCSNNIDGRVDCKLKCPNFLDAGSLMPPSPE